MSCTAGDMSEEACSTATPRLWQSRGLTFEDIAWRQKMLINFITNIITIMPCLFFIYARLLRLMGVHSLPIDSAMPHDDLA